MIISFFFYITSLTFIPSALSAQGPNPQGAINATCSDMCAPMGELAQACFLADNQTLTINRDDGTIALNSPTLHACLCDNTSFNVSAVAALCASCLEQSGPWWNTDNDGPPGHDDGPGMMSNAGGMGMGSQSMMITTLPSATRPFHSLMTSMMSTGAGGIVGGLMGGLMGAVAEEAMSDLMSECSWSSMSYSPSDTTLASGIKVTARATSATTGTGTLGTGSAAAATTNAAVRALGSGQQLAMVVGLAGMLF